MLMDDEFSGDTGVVSGAITEFVGVGCSLKST